MKRYVMAAAALSLLVLGAVDARAQTGAARGKVLDEQGQPLADVKVEVEFQGGITRKLEIKTNKKGEYVQVGLQPGVYKFTATKEGFQGAFVEAKVSLGEPTLLSDLKLKSASAKGGAGGGAGDITAAFTAASDLQRAGKLDEAEAAYKEILVKNPSIPEVHRNLGLLYGQKKDWASAEAAYQKALELRPGYSAASTGLARVYLESGQKDKAFETMKQAAASNETDAEAQFNLGVFHLNAQQLDEAEASFKKVETIDPANVEVHYYLGTVALNKGNSAEAVARLEKYLASSPKNTQNVATAQQLLAALKPKK